ncbi:unnamed protein product [Caenorhabditis nigoni]
MRREIGLVVYLIAVSVIFYMIKPSNKIQIRTKLVVDDKPGFYDKHRMGQSFVFNFDQMPDEDFPEYNFLVNKNGTHYATSNSTEHVSIFPSCDYQAVFVYVYEGNTSVQIKICNESVSIAGGVASKGWNLIAMDFPELLEQSRCPNFKMGTDRPVLSFHGSASYSVWKNKKFLNLQPPVPTIVFVFLIAQVVFAASLVIHSCHVCYTTWNDLNSYRQEQHDRKRLEEDYVTVDTD